MIFTSHSGKLAISIRTPFFVRSVILLASHSEKLASLCYSRAILKSPRSLFAHLFFSAASSICTPFFVRSISNLRAILKSSQSLFARHSEKRCVLFFFGGCPMEHINCSSLHLRAIVHGGERYFVQEDLLSHEYSPPRLSVSRTNLHSLV